MSSAEVQYESDKRIAQYIEKIRLGGTCPTKQEIEKVVNSTVDKVLEEFPSADEDTLDFQVEIKAYRENTIKKVKAKFATMFREVPKSEPETAKQPQQNKQPKLEVPQKTESKTYHRDSTSEWTRTNVSYSGADMYVSAECTVNTHRFRVSMGSIQTLTYSVYDKLTPIYALGNVNAKDYVHSHRVIAGSMIFAVFNAHWAKNVLLQYAKVAGIDASQKLLMDEIPPLDITVSMGNEYGSASRLAIYGVRLFNEGMTMSINDVYTEHTQQFMAMNIDYLEDVRSIDVNIGSGGSTTAPTNTKLPIVPPNDGGEKTEPKAPRPGESIKKTPNGNGYTPDENEIEAPKPGGNIKKTPGDTDYIPDTKEEGQAQKKTESREKSEAENNKEKAEQTLAMLESVVKQQLNSNVLRTMYPTSTPRLNEALAKDKRIVSSYMSHLNYMFLNGMISEADYNEKKADAETELKRRQQQIIEYYADGLE